MDKTNQNKNQNKRQVKTFQNVEAQKETVWVHFPGHGEIRLSMISGHLTVEVYGLVCDGNIDFERYSKNAKRMTIKTTPSNDYEVFMEE